MTVEAADGKRCPKCGSAIEPDDRFCRSCGKAQVFVEMAVWKQFALAIGSIVALLLVLGVIFAIVEGFENEIEAAVAEAAGGHDAVQSVDCSPSSPETQAVERYRCEVDFHEGPCEEWGVVLRPGEALGATRMGVASDC
jgi:predicted nucleic acid-binding Zn ribbon protein